jgi:hypothetical protein
VLAWLALPGSGRFIDAAAARASGSICARPGHLLVSKARWLLAGGNGYVLGDPLLALYPVRHLAIVRPVEPDRRSCVPACSTPACIIEASYNVRRHHASTAIIEWKSEKISYSRAIFDGLFLQVA